MPIPYKVNESILKPYNIVTNEDDNSATINMYGEVVAKHPTDWWTGEKLSGNYIALDDFLQDLDELKGKDSITVHINSVGGDFFAGLSIYNRLRTLGAKITTINDSLAASAGSIIFMAGDSGKRKVHAASTLMVHGVMGFLYGYYNVADLRETIAALKAHDKTLVAAYMEATGLSEETVRAAISKDTYMTGQEAVDAGWADEVISTEGEGFANMALTPNKSHLMVNGHAVAARLFGKLPEGIPQMTAEEYAALSTPANTENPSDQSMQPAPQADINKIQNGGTNMEFQTPEELRNACPDLVAQIEAAARAEGAAAERNRIQGIEEVENGISDAELVRNAKYGENPMNSEQLIVAAFKVNAINGTQAMAALQTDTANSGVAAVTATAAPVGEPKPADEAKTGADELVNLYNSTK